MNPLRVLQVGLGGWGRDWAHRFIPEMAEVDLVGYVDPEPSALARLRDVTPVAPVQCCLTLEHAIEATKPEAVLVTATLPGHEPVTRAALAAGLHVLIEKPFAESGDVARKLVELAAAKRKVLMVSQNYRFFPAARKVAQLVSEARLGKLHEISIDFRRHSSGTVSGRGRHHVEDQPLLVDMSIHPRVIPLPALPQTDRWGTLAEFARAVREGREPECSGRDNLGTLAVVAAAVESAQLGQPVDLSPKQARAKLAI